MNRSLDSAEQAAALIGGGQPCSGLQSFCRALSQQTASQAEHWLLIGTPDSSIGEVAAALGKCWQDCTQADLPLAWAFHLSGQQGPEVLQGLALQNFRWYRLLIQRARANNWPRATACWPPDLLRSRPWQPCLRSWACM